MIENHTCVTPCGAVRGSGAQPGVSAFRGIRYAHAGRWQYPIVVTHWEGILDATRFGPNALQTAALRPAGGKLSFYDHEFREGLPYSYSEDCQYLNIYAPDDAVNAPVIVYIHGGAFLGGSGWDKVFDEPVWPLHGVIAVTLNYRLGIFAGMALPDLIQEAGHAGNYQLYDQLAALQWVHDNIAAFGGDPDNVTLMGQSAGARSVQMLGGSPAARGLFRRAVMSSGGGEPSHLGSSNATEEERCAFWQEWRKTLGSPDLPALRAMPGEELLKSLGPMFEQYGFSEVLRFISPGFDQAAFPAPWDEAALEGGCLPIPCLCGATSEDIVPGLTEDALRWTMTRPEPSYAWYFSRALPGDEKGAWHSADLWYWFGTLKHGWRPFAQEDYVLSDIMVRFLCNFARTGNPNGQGLPAWKPGKQSEQVLRLDTVCAMMTAPRAFEQKGYVL